jgi:YheO-like PAS domain
MRFSKKACAGPLAFFDSSPRNESPQTLVGRPHETSAAESPARRRRSADSVARFRGRHGDSVLSVHGSHRSRPRDPKKIAHVADNLSRRKVGDDSALDHAEFHPDETIIGPYEKRNWDGATLRAVSIVIRDATSSPIGVVCINLNIGIFDQARAALDLLVSGTLPG